MPLPQPMYGLLHLGDDPRQLTDITTFPQTDRTAEADVVFPVLDIVGDEPWTYDEINQIAVHEPSLIPEEPPTTGGGGGFFQFEWMFDFSITAPPTGTEIRANNADQTAADMLYIKTATADGFDATAFLAIMTTGDRIYIQDKDDSTMAQLYTITGDSVDHGTYFDLPVAWDQQGVDPLVEQRVLVTLIRSGTPGSGVPPAGTTGQVIVKSSDENYDTEWQDQSAIDAGKLDGEDGSFYQDASNLNAGSLPFDRIQVSAASKVLGRDDSGPGAMQELTLGSNLIISGSTLNALSEVEGSWRYAPTTIMADPTAGKVRGDNTTGSLITEISLHRLTETSRDLYGTIRSLVGGDTINIQDENTPANWLRFTVTGVPTDHTNWFQIPVSYITGGGSSPAADDLFFITFGFGGVVPGSGYTDEQAQDAIGVLLTGTATIDLTYDDSTPSITADVKTGSITNSLLADMADGTVKGRLPGISVGPPEDISLGPGGGLDADTIDGIDGDDIVLLGGRPAGQYVYGGQLASGDLTLESTSHTAKGDVIIQPNGGGLDLSGVSGNFHLPTGAGTFIGAGTGTGLDSDLLDGQHGSFYQNASNLNAGTLDAARLPAFTGDVTSSAGASVNTIAADAVTNTKLANMAQATIKGRASGAGTGDPTDLTGAQVAAITNASLDHGVFLGLTDDDHTQYALLAGRASGQTLYGGIAASENLTIGSTSHATKGFVNVAPAGGNVAIGHTSPSTVLHVRSAADPAIRLQENSQNGYIELVHIQSTQAALRGSFPTSADLLIDPNPADGTSASTVRLFRSTTTTGLTALQLYKGDGSATGNAVIAGQGANSYVCADNGSFGVGTASPLRPFHVSGAAGTDGALKSQAIISATEAYNASPFAGIEFVTKYTAAGALAGLGGIGAGKENTTDTNTASYLTLYSRAAGGAIAERMRIDSSGNVAVNTGNFTVTAGDATIAAGTLAVGLATTALRTAHVSGAGTVGGDLNSQLMVASTAAYNASPFAGIIFANKYTSLGAIAEMGGIGAGKENTTDANNAGFLALYSRPSGLTVTERMRIDSAGRVGIGTNAPATSAILELSSTTGALLLPRMTSTQRDALTAVNGMVIYNSTTNKAQVRAAAAWVDLH